MWFHVSVNAIAIDERGQFACLGGKKALYIVDLDNPWETVRKLHHQSKFEVGTVQFNPHPTHRSFLASTANTNTLIWNLDDRRFALQSTFRAHDRPVLDLGWSYGDANLLATCSADTHAVLWDTRSPKNALRITTISPHAPVHLLKWNRKQTNILATSSNGEVRIWDVRNEKRALTSITAHAGKISTLDWSHNNENALLTAGQDAQVKCWDITNPRKEKTTIQVGLPVALASYTPFDCGVVTAAQRDDFCPRLWSLSDTAAPIYSFGLQNAHQDVVTSMEWRTSTNGDKKQYQLVTWSKDQHLKCWKIDQPIFDRLDRRDDEKGDLFLPGTAGSALGTLVPGMNRTTSWDDPRGGLTQEFALLRQNPVKGVTLRRMDAAQASCEVTGLVGSYQQELNITFPSAYPYSAPPSFHLPPNPTVSTRIRNKLKTALSLVAERYVNVSRSCLEPCLLEFITTLEKEAAKHGDRSASDGLVGLGYEGIDSIMGMGPLGMGLSSGSVNIDRLSSLTANRNTPPEAAALINRKRSDNLLDMVNGSDERTITASDTKATHHGMRLGGRAELTASREKSNTLTGGSGVGAIGRASSNSNRTQSYSSASTVVSPSLMGGASPLISSPTSSPASSLDLSFGRDEAIPAPRTCGAIFSIDGLVEFRSFMSSGDSSTQALASSRSYADFKKQLGMRDPSSEELGKNAFVEITKIYFYEEVVDLLPIKMDLSTHSKGTGAQGKDQELSNIVVIRNGAPILPISRDLAHEYVLTGLAAYDLCAKNGLAAKKLGRKDLVQLWTLMGHLMHPSLHPSPSGSMEAPWSYHPFGRKLVASLFNYYQSMGDIQTMAMLSCILSVSSVAAVAPSTASTASPSSAPTVSTPVTAPASSPSTSFFPSIFRRDSSSNGSTGADEGRESGGKGKEGSSRSKDKRDSSGVAKHLKRNRVNSSVSSTGTMQTGLSFASVESIISAMASAESPPPPPPPPDTSPPATPPHWSSFSTTTPSHQRQLLDTILVDAELPTAGGIVVGSLGSSGLATSPPGGNHTRMGEHRRTQSFTNKRLAAKQEAQLVAKGEDLNSLLEPLKQHLYDHYKRSYGEMLYRWGLLEKRAEVLKFLRVSSKQKERMRIGFSLSCHNCNQPITGPSPLCSTCRTAAFRCTLCHTPVRGLSNFCLVCGHGGHMHHMREWFARQSYCPSGCGCSCLVHTPSLLSY